MWEYLVQTDGKVRRMSEAQLRRRLSKKKYKGLELARRSDDPTWRPLGQLPIFAEEVAFEGDPLDHARSKAVAGFAMHFLAYLAVNVVAGFPLPLLLFWGIGLVAHGAKTYPHALVLNDANKLPLIGNWARLTTWGPTPQPKLPAPPRAAIMPPASMREGGPPARAVTAPAPTVEPVGLLAEPADPALLPTLGAAPAPATDVERNQLHASVRGRLFGDDAATPVTIGRYKLGPRLGAGGMGVVFSAHDTSLDRPVALKLLRPGYEMAAASERLQREARAMARLSHPNVVTVFDVGTYEGSVFVAMEHVDGVTLRTWLSEPHAVGDVVGVMVQAAEGLAAAHTAGLVHRDFKPENVMVGHDGRVRVLDFGLAKPTDANTTQDLLTQTGTLLGTPRYMSPEQFRGEPADARTDQFSLGVVFYEALFGVHPYQPTDERPLPRAVMAGKLRDTPTRADVPSAVRTTILRAVAHVPEQRHDDLARFAASLGPIPSTSDALASLAAASRRLLAHRPADAAAPVLQALDDIETTVAELDARAAVLDRQADTKEVDATVTALAEAQAALASATSDAERSLANSKCEALGARLEGLHAARDMLERLRTKRSVAETQLKQLHLDLLRAEAGEAELPDLTGPLQELRFQVDAAQEVEALLDP